MLVNTSVSELLPGEWALSDACVAYDLRSSRHGGERQLHGTLLAQRAAGQLQHMVWPPSTEEGSARLIPHVARGSQKRVEKDANTSLLRWPQLWHDEGVLLTTSMDNIWHVLWHAVPIHEMLLR